MTQTCRLIEESLVIEELVGGLVLLGLAESYFFADVSIEVGIVLVGFGIEMVFDALLPLHLSFAEIPNVVSVLEVELDRVFLVGGFCG